MSPELIWQKAKEIAGSAEDKHKAVLQIISLLKQHVPGETGASDMEKAYSVLSRLVKELTAEKRQMNESSESSRLRKDINDYYLREELVKAILSRGEIPKDPLETILGVGFIDIVDYTYLSKWLSPKENQVVLNGLYSAFNHVLKKHGGYLNKMEGDSLLFHFGGLVDKRIESLQGNELWSFLAGSVFRTCIEMQHVCDLFNKADPHFLAETTDDETAEPLEAAFDIIKTLRENLAMAAGINVLFQIRIRIGASIGEVSIGNFGPAGAKQWDVIGMPVIEAKRMQDTAPIGGIRMSENFFDILDINGITDDYLQTFKDDARRNNGVYRNITKSELFNYKRVIVHEKKNSAYDTYSVLVDPNQPEHIIEHIQALLIKDEDGVRQIIDEIMYYRGNRFIVNVLENFLNEKSIELNKSKLLEVISPKRYRVLESEAGKSGEAISDVVDKYYSLYDIFSILGKFMDHLNLELSYNRIKDVEFESTNQYVEDMLKAVDENFKSIKKLEGKSLYVNKCLLPQLRAILSAGLINHQHETFELEPI